MSKNQEKKRYGVVVSGKTNVLIDGKPVAVLGNQVVESDEYHGVSAGASSGTIVSGASNILIDNIPVARVGDNTTTGDLSHQILASGSPTVLFGGKPAVRLGDKSF